LLGKGEIPLELSPQGARKTFTAERAEIAGIFLNKEERLRIF
jgi:hypothetical protein